MLGLAAVGLFSAIYHPVGVAWLIRSARSRGMALAVNGIFGSLGVASAGLVAGVLIDAVSWRAAFIVPGVVCLVTGIRSEEHTSELQSLMRISYAVFCLKKKNNKHTLNYRKTH